MKFNPKKLKLEMERAGVNQTELARQMKTTKQAVNQWLKGKVKTFAIVNKIAKHFSLDGKDFVN